MTAGEPEAPAPRPDPHSLTIALMRRHALQLDLMRCEVDVTIGRYERLRDELQDACSDMLQRLDDVASS